MKIEQVPVESVSVGARHRAVLVEDKVTALVESINAVGLLQPIMVYTPDDSSVELVAGRHRLEAAKRLEWDFIDAVFISGDEIDRELAEIDENLCRAELTEAEEASHLKRRQALWEARKSRDAELNIGTSCPENKPRGRPEGFAGETAKVTGESKRSINRKIVRAAKIAPYVLEEITGSKWDKGVVLDILKKLTHDEQHQALQQVKDGVSPSFQDAYGFIRGEDGPPKRKSSVKRAADPLSDTETVEKQVAKIMAAWNAASKEAREVFLARIDQPVFDSTRAA